MIGFQKEIIRSENCIVNILSYMIKIMKMVFPKRHGVIVNTILGKKLTIN